MKNTLKILMIASLLAALVCVPVFAAPSPAAGSVNIIVGGKQVPLSSGMKTPTEKDTKQIQTFIFDNAASLGKVANVKSTVTLVAPAGYKKGEETPIVLASAGLKDGARNVFAYILLPNGKIIIRQCTIKNGYVGFMIPAFGTVSIVELNDAAKTASGLAKLH